MCIRDRVKVVDTVINVFGETEYALDFFKSDAAEGPWFFVDNSFITINKSMMIKTEFGLDFIASVSYTHLTLPTSDLV